MQGKWEIFGIDLSNETRINNQTEAVVKSNEDEGELLDANQLLSFERWYLVKKSEEYDRNTKCTITRHIVRAGVIHECIESLYQMCEGLGVCTS